MELLMSTPHGSRLYGLAHADSDEDTFEVWRGRPTKQTTDGHNDVLRVSYDDFLAGVGKGVPQYLEALYSPSKTVDRLYFLRLQPGYGPTVKTYTRTMRSFWRDDNFKKRRHSARLYLNLLEFMEKGYFNPTLTEEEKDWVNAYAESALDAPRL